MCIGSERTKASKRYIWSQRSDIAIKTVSDALKGAAPADVRIIRTGGDEFLLIAPVDDDFDFVSEMERKMQSYLDTYNGKSNDPFDVSASYGSVKVRAKDVEVFDALIEEADKKMYRMKEATDPYRRQERITPI